MNPWFPEAYCGAVQFITGDPDQVIGKSIMAVDLPADIEDTGPGMEVNGTHPLPVMEGNISWRYQTTHPELIIISPIRDYFSCCI